MSIDPDSDSAPSPESSPASDPEPSAEPDTGPGSRFWVGIGASAGGLEALRNFVRKLPPGLPATYLVAQHMAPHQKSLLTEIIGRETSLPVIEASDGEVPEANTIHIAPPNSNILVEGGRMRLAPPSDQPGAPKPSVDVLFESLAVELGERAVAVVLSGTGSDGAKGVLAVRAHGGLTVAQDDDSAKYTGMPSAARDTGAIDLVLSPEELGTRFPQLLDSSRDLSSLRPEPLTGHSMRRLMELLHQRTKVDFSHYKTATVQRRVERRMVATGAHHIEHYVRIASDSPEEVDELFKDLLITVTSFFRDPEEFEALETHVAQLIAERPGGPFRVWVAGVATGEEAYTLAIQFAEALGGPSAFAAADLQIFATDIDPRAIDVARRGVYPEASLAGLGPERASAWFEPCPGGYAVRRALREKIVFSVHDVTRDPPFLKLDLVSCRNLLIYFRSELQARVFERFHYALKDDAILFLGKSEAVSASASLFRASSSDRRIFRRKAADRRPPGERGPAERNAPFVPTRYVARPVAPSAYAAPPAPVADGAASRLESLIRALGENSLLLDSDTRILRVHGNVDAYAGLSSRAKGAIDTTASSLLREPWSQDVRVGVPVALRSMSVYEGMVRPAPHAPGRRSRVTVYPMEDKVRNEKLAVAVFRTWEERLPDVAALVEDETPDHWTRAMATLAQELELARANLQITSEQLETANEELQSANEEMQAANEELQSANEELQSTNEELETSSEELQSTNEELSTVNDEMRINASLLARTNRRQRSILDNVLTPMVVVDESMRIVDAGPSAVEAFGIPPDRREPHLSECRPPEGFPPLERFVSESIERGAKRTAQIQTETISAVLSAAPYWSPEGELQGAIVQIGDSSDALAEAVAQLGLIFEHVPVALALSDTAGRVVAANGNAHRWLGLEAPALVGTRSHEHLPEELAGKLAELDRSALESGETTLGDTHLLTVEGLEPKWVRTTHVPFAHADSGETMVLLMSEDLTRQHEQERRTAYFRTRLELALEASDIGTWDRDLDTGEYFWSDRFREIAGLPADLEPSADAFLDRLHPDDREEFVHAIAGHVERDAPWLHRARVVREGGEVRWVVARGRRLGDESGTKIVGTLIDETELVDRLERLTAANNHLELAERLAATGYWRLDLGERRQLFWSDQVYAIHGLDPRTYNPTLEEGIDFYHPEDRGRVAALVEGAIANATGFEFTARIRHAEGGYRHVEALGVVRRDEGGGGDQLFGVFADVTERTERERSLREAHDELARSNEELGRFSYVCSHDMKEPVRLIESMASLLLGTDPAEHPDQTRDLIARIQANTVRLRAIIDGLLAYSRVEARVETGPVDLGRVAHEIRDALGLLVEEKRASIEIAEDLPTVHGARVHFTQLIQNLVGNALAYTDAERPVVRIGSREIEGGTELVIEDNGPGIPEAQRKRVFDVFSRLELDSAVEGTGLGLSICQRIVQQYDGTIECTDSDLGGAGFRIRLPAPTDEERP